MGKENKNATAKAAAVTAKNDSKREKKPFIEFRREKEVKPIDPETKAEVKKDGDIQPLGQKGREKTTRTFIRIGNIYTRESKKTRTVNKYPTREITNEGKETFKGMKPVIDVNKDVKSSFKNPFTKTTRETTKNKNTRRDEEIKGFVGSPYLFSAKLGPGEPERSVSKKTKIGGGGKEKERTKERSSDNLFKDNKLTEKKRVNKFKS